MTNSHVNERQDTPERWWTHIAVASWLISLALPGFITVGDVEPWSGIGILLAGLFFAWTSHGWAVYANLFFISIANSLYRGGKPGQSVWAMLALAATLPWFPGIYKEGAGVHIPVSAWGWGVVAWILSLVLLAIAAAIRNGVLGATGSKIAAAGVALALLAAGVAHRQQWIDANSQERQVYLSDGLAFANRELCGVPFVWPEGAVVPRDAVVTLDVNGQLSKPLTGEPYLSLPTLFRVQHDGYAWITRRAPWSSPILVTIREEARPDQPRLLATKTSSGALIQLIDAEEKRVLYEQPLRTVRQDNGGAHFCPSLRAYGRLESEFAVDSALLRALGQSEKIDGAKVLLTDEVASTPCQIGARDIDGLKDYRTWDGRVARLWPESLRSQWSYCSDRYVALIYLSEYPGGTQSRLSGVVHVFNRETLAPIAVFNDGRSCPSRGCENADANIIAAVRISDAAVVVETSRGELRTNRVK